MTSEKYIILGRRTAITSFIIGTCILALYAVTLAFPIAFMGLIFLLIAVPLNLIVLLILLFKAAADTTLRKKSLLTAGLVLTNIPVATIFMFIQSGLSNTIRMTFNNSTKAVLTDIHVTGCESKFVGKLVPGESKTVWIHTPNDCAIIVDYLENGKRKSADAAGYVTNDMGQYMIYNIGGVNESF